MDCMENGAENSIVMECVWLTIVMECGCRLDEEYVCGCECVPQWVWLWV